MSYGLFTVGREELDDLPALARKLELATGELQAAQRLSAELGRAADQDPATEYWHVVPKSDDPTSKWGIEPVRGA